VKRRPRRQDRGGVGKSPAKFFDLLPRLCLLNRSEAACPNTKWHVAAQARLTELGLFGGARERRCEPPQNGPQTVYLETFKAEIAGFPFCKYFDQVDSIVQFLGTLDVDNALTLRLTAFPEKFKAA
jgi:hypothetical protein